MTPAWGVHLSCFSRFVKVTGSVPENFRTRPVGNVPASAFPLVHQRRTGDRFGESTSTRTVVLCNHGAVWCTPLDMVVKNFDAAGWEEESNGEGYSEACLH